MYNNVCDRLKKKKNLPHKKDIILYIVPIFECTIRYGDIISINKLTNMLETRN